ncbi:MAG: hypothetical protein ACRDZ7_15530 [Acidimicrobiia bacterium]
MNGGTSSRSDRLAKVVGAGCLFAIAAWMTVQHPPEGALFFLMPVVGYWRELRAMIRRARH